MGLPDHVEAITKVGEVAGKEFSIEQALDKMEEEWEPMLLDISPYKETGTCIMKSGEECAQQLDDHIVMTQAMSFSPYKKPFDARIISWENKLRTTQVKLLLLFLLMLLLQFLVNLNSVLVSMYCSQDVMEEWAICQRSWLYLEPIFTSEDINQQLPVEGKRYQTMDRMWRKIMNNARQDPKVKLY